MFVPEEIRFVEDACRRLGLTLTNLDPFSGHLARVSDGTASFLTGAGRICAYPLNGASVADIARDKAHTAALLQQAGFKVPEGRLFFISASHRALRPPGRELADLPDYAETLGYPLLVKPNDGSRGNLVEIVDDEAELTAYAGRAAARTGAILVQRIIDLPEYRLFLLDGEVRFAYRRLANELEGDGASVRDTLSRHNAACIAAGLSPVAEQCGWIRRQLDRLGLGLDDPLPPGTRFRPSPRGNISAGGRIAEFRQDVPPLVATWARRLFETLPLRVCAIDLFASEITDPDGFVVIEVNGNPSLTGVATLRRRDVVIDLWVEICRRALP
jgi:glutathione synthase/RimK-type ligase-like ATP-grasp enzyme